MEHDDDYTIEPLRLDPAAHTIRTPDAQVHRTRAAREAVDLLGPASDLYRTRSRTEGDARPAGFQGVISGATKPGESSEHEGLGYVDAVLDLARWIEGGAR